MIIIEPGDSLFISSEIPSHVRNNAPIEYMAWEMNNI